MWNNQEIHYEEHIVVFHVGLFSWIIKCFFLHLFTFVLVEENVKDMKWYENIKNTWETKFIFYKKKIKIYNFMHLA